jgi:hypothetical protein
MSTHVSALYSLMGLLTRLAGTGEAQRAADDGYQDDAQVSGIR